MSASAAARFAGTQEMRTKIGHIGFWASVLYGNGICMTVSPSERHNDLSIRLSRYRAQDPLVEEKHKPWLCSNAPSLEPHLTGQFEVEIPGYDLRRLWMAEDPLAAVNSLSCKYAPCSPQSSVCACAQHVHTARRVQTLVEATRT